MNKRRSKALFILSTNQVVADDDAVDDWDEVAEEVARPDGIIRAKKGSRFEIRNVVQLAEEHVNLMQQDRQFIESTGGVTDEMMGGKATRNPARPSSPARTRLRRHG